MNAPPPRRGASASARTLAYDRGRALPETARLLVTAGPAKGAEHTLAARCATVGRAAQNLLVLPDPSVSRRHSRIEKQGERWVLLDQGSGNGTRVNGRRVERHALRHGDEIEIGKTRLRFVEPGGVLVNAAAAAPVPPARLAVPAKPWAAAFLLAIAAAVTLASVLRPAPAPAAQDDESRAFARKRFQEGVALLRQGKWPAAREKLRIAVELDGQDEEIARYVQSVEHEAPRAAQLETAREALLRNDLDTARGALAGIPDDSVLAASTGELWRKLREAEASRAAAAPPGKASPRRRRRSSLPPPGELQPVLDAYLSGDLAEALRRAREAHGARAAQLLSDLDAFDAASREGLAMQRAGRDGEAVRKLEEAQRLDLRIAGGKESRGGLALRKRLSALHLRIAAALPSDDEALAVTGAHLSRALAADPGNAEAQVLLRNLTARCRDIYLRGYLDKENDPQAARKAFALVAAALPASDETAQKARRWMEKLDRKGPERE